MTEYNVRFTAIVPVPNDGVGANIVFTGRIKSVDEANKTATIALTATHEGKKIFGRAVAIAKLARNGPSKPTSAGWSGSTRSRSSWVASRSVREVGQGPRSGQRRPGGGRRIPATTDWSRR